MLIYAYLALFVFRYALCISVPISPSKSYEFDIEAPDWLNRFAGSGFTAWGGHAIFAEWLVKAIHPQLIVDLGIDLGYSTFVWSTALNKVSSDAASKGQKLSEARVVGIDSFQFQIERDTRPDMVRDAYGFVTAVMDKFQTEYANVEVIKGYFKEVSDSWTEGQTVDILHVDGRHEYEHAKEDYFAWNKYVKPDGMVLFHDCYVWNQENFGVYRLFDEITEYRFRGYFENDYGLGVATNNEKLFSSIALAFQHFKIGSKITIPSYALPSYFQNSDEKPVAGVNPIVTAPSGSLELVLDLADVTETNEIVLLIKLPDSSASITAIGSARLSWNEFMSSVESAVDLRAAQVSGTAVGSDRSLSVAVIGELNRLTGRNYSASSLEWMSELSPSCTVLHLFKLAGSADYLDVAITDQVSLCLLSGDLSLFVIVYLYCLS